MRYGSPILLVVLGALFGSLLVLSGCDAVDTATEATNETPTAEATVASSQPFNVNDPVQLDGTGSSDPDGDELTYEWTLDIPSESNASLEGPNTVDPTFTPDVKGTYTATLEVSDGEDTDTDDVNVMAEGNVIGSNITSDRTLSSDLDHLVTDDICVQNGATLTIEAGTKIMFESNTSLQVCDNNAALIASGTSDNPIVMTGTQSDPEGWWQGVASYSTNPNNELNYVEIEDAGGQEWGSMSAAASVAINSGNQLTLTNSTVRNGGGLGLHLDEGDGDLSFSSNTFSGNQIAPANVPFTVIGEIDAASSFEDGTYVRVWDANPGSGDVTVDALEVPYRIAGTPNLTGTVSVTINPGVEMEFTANSNLTIDGNDASLMALGESGNTITMTGTQSDPEGWWQGVASYSTNPNNELNYVEIEDAGSQEWGSMSAAASVAINRDNQLTLTNSTVRSGGGLGLHLDESEGDLSFSNNTFSGNQIAPANVPFTVIGEIDAASSFENGTYVRVWDANPGSGDVTVDALEVPYRIAGTPGLSGTVNVTIDPGVKMEFTANSNLTVDSDDASLIVNGQSGNEVLMTATPNNRNPGFWQGVGFYSNNPNNEITHAVIEYAGSQDWGSMSAAANIGLNRDAQLSLTNSEITNSGQHGVHCDEPNDSSFSGSSNTFSNNAGNDVNGCSQ